MNTKSIPALTPISRLSLKTIATNTESKYLQLKSKYNTTDVKIQPTNNIGTLPSERYNVENKQELQLTDKNSTIAGDNNHHSMNFQKNAVKTKTTMGIGNGRSSLEITANKNEPVIDLNNRYMDNNNSDINVISSDNETKDQDIIAVPDSTTQVIKTVQQQYNIGEDVLVQQKDGRYFLGTIIAIDLSRDQCLVKFGDNTESWSNTKELTHLNSPESDCGPLCVVCKSMVNKELDKVIVCDKCGRGYHQKCHTPKVLNTNGIWNCRRCVDQIHHMRKLENKNMRREIRRNSSTVEVLNNPVMTTITTSQNQLPYDLSLLTWDEYHRMNIEQTYCYCGTSGEWYRQMLQCARCRQWFHERCIKCLQYPLYNGDRFYVFVCSLCNYGSEFVRRLEMKWVDLVHLLLYNLTTYKHTKYYDLDNVIIPYANDNWHALQLPSQMKNISQPELREQFISALSAHSNSNSVHCGRFKCGRENKKKVSIWGLRNRQPPPAPCVTIGFNGVVTDRILRDNWKGNKRLQFLDPTPLVRPHNTTISRSNSFPGTNFGVTKISQQSTNIQSNMVVPLDSNMLEKMTGHSLQDSDLESICSMEFTEDLSKKELETIDNTKCFEMDYTEDGFVQKNHTKTNEDDLKLILKIDVSENTVTGSRKRKNVRRDNVIDKLNMVCPPTPPTSVSAPPTPPANNFTSNSNDMNYNLTEKLVNMDCESKDSDSITNIKTVYDNLKSEFKNDICDSSDETSSRCTLDSIIPPPKDFQGKNNPFHSMPKNDAVSTKGKSKPGRKSKKSDEKLVAKPAVRTLKRKLSEKDLLMGENGDIKRRKFKKSKMRNSLPETSTASKTASYTPLLTGDSKEWSQQRSLRSSLNSTLPQTTSTPISNCVDYALNGRRLRQRQDITYAEHGRRNSCKIGPNNHQSPLNTSPVVNTSSKVTDVCITDLKSSVNMYFGAMNRILSGEKFVVQGKRVNSDGKVQYLIEWEGGPS